MKVIKRVLKKFALALLSVLVCFSSYTLFMTKILHKDYVNIFGYTYFVVASGSMSGTIEVNDIIIDKIAEDYAINDIITYKENGAFITHRVIKITENEVITRGDVNNIDDSPVLKDNIIGRVTFIISISFLLKLFAVIIFILIIYIILDFDNIFKKYIIKEKETEKEKKKRKTPLEYTHIFKLNKNLTTESDNINQESKEEKSHSKTLTELDYEKKFLELVLKMLKSKKKPLKLTTQGSLKIKYVYELAVTSLMDPSEIINCLKNTPFEELYDYDFEDILFTKNIRDKLYEMPMYIFIKLLVYCLLYDENEFFDATFKILKYRVKIDKDSAFINDNKNINEALELIEKTIKEVGHESDFNLDLIREKIEIDSELKNMNGNSEFQRTEVVKASKLEEITNEKLKENPKEEEILKEKETTKTTPIEEKELVEEQIIKEELTNNEEILNASGAFPKTVSENQNDILNTSELPKLKIIEKKEKTSKKKEETKSIKSPENEIKTSSTKKNNHAYRRVNKYKTQKKDRKKSASL